MAIKSFRMINIQTHVDTLIELPETGVVRFKGENNEGKSVLTKVLFESVGCRLNRKDVRKSLVRNGCTSGDFLITKYDNSSLQIHIDHESAHTYYLLKRPGELDLMRYVSDKHLEHIVQLFGFQYNKKREFSLNIYQTYDQLIGINTPRSMTYEVVDEAITDISAKVALDSLESTQSDLKVLVQTMSQDRDKTAAQLGMLPVYDTVKEIKYAELTTRYIDLYDLLTIPTLPDVKPYYDVSALDYLETDFVKDVLVDIKDNFDELLSCVEMVYTLGDNLDIIDKIIELNKMEKALADEMCPICQRGFVAC